MIVSVSACSRLSAYVDAREDHAATYSQCSAAFGGSHLAGPRSPFELFVGPSTARSSAASLAKASRCSSVHSHAPACQA